MLKVVGWGPALGIAYSAERFKFWLSVNNYEPLEMNISHESRAYSYQILNLDRPQEPASFRIEEAFTPKGYSDKYIIWNVAIQYKIHKGLNFHGGFETTFDRPYDNYRLHIYEYLVDKLETVNDFKLLNKYTAVTVGMSYSFPFGKLAE